MSKQLKGNKELATWKWCQIFSYMSKCIFFKFFYCTNLLNLKVRKAIMAVRGSRGPRLTNVCQNQGHSIFQQLKDIVNSWSPSCWFPQAWVFCVALYLFSMLLSLDANWEQLVAVMLTFLFLLLRKHSVGDLCSATSLGTCHAGHVFGPSLCHSSQLLRHLI